MTIQEAEKMLDETASKLGEFFDAVQILATWNQEGSTMSCPRGAGNWYARQRLAHEFINSDISQDSARRILELDLERLRAELARLREDNKRLREESVKWAEEVSDLQADNQRLADHNKWLAAALEAIESTAHPIRDPMDMEGGDIAAADKRFEHIEHIARAARDKPPCHWCEEARAALAAHKEGEK